ncbi:uncharacterized protein LOC123557840 [Mercenaria mercenaria]|uniref:uncharacterized protein LOC123557840 n=1 Tax=Mercenaria mercenaria TaxID=6596 RepID=UPI00234F03EA|nr:uncharacterized protein LOC123557840 [Mercenaria mercenaria]
MGSVRHMFENTSSTATTLKFKKLSAPATEVSGGGYASKIEIKYSDYMTGGLETSATTYTIENTAAGKAISGVMKCDTATMPTSVIFNENVSGTSPLTATYNGGTCYEGGKASTLFDSSSDSVTPYALDLQAYPGHVLQLRVRACGEAVLQFFMNENDLTHSLFLTVTHKQMTVTKCFPDCGTGPTFVIDDTAGFNSGASADWDCEADMAFFWFHQKTDNSKHYICFGVGKYDEAVCTGAETTTYFEITSRFKNVKMMGMASDAAFNWDFVHTGGCDLYESDWRCMDRWTNCSIYGTSFCSDAQHNDFAVSYCAKYCGKCFADSYGRKFLAKTPYVNPSTDCLMIVSPLNKQTNVAVTLKDTNAGTEKVQHGARNHNGERYYDCSESLGILDAYTILSDDEVAVNILLTYSGEIKSYRIYPVDTFGTEVMVLEYSDEKKRCRFLSEHDSVNYVAYYSINKLGGTGDSEDSERVQLGALSHLATTNLNDMSGTVFKFDKPSTVFCGDLFSSSTVHNQYNQLLPTNTWSTEYVVPAFDVEAVNRPFDGKLFIVSNADNTIVNISGGFDAIHAIYNRGDKIEQEIDVGAAYKIKASENIGVGLYLYDPADPTKASFNMLVPAQSFHDTVLTSVPNNVLNDVGFDVTEIKTYFIDGNLNGTIVSKEADDTDPFYRHVSIGSSIYEMTVVQSGTEKWFVVPGNVKSAVIQNQGQVCEMSPQSDNDGIDNDCDGLIDEDTRYSTYGVYREDRDLDGGFGEDSSEVLNEPVVIKKPREPICLEIKKPPGQCWTICFCKCSWVKKYEEQKNLTHDELVEAQQDDIQQLQNELQVDEDSLQTATAEKESASDERQSAANIGYIGICMFGVVFGTIFIMDISSLVRDLRILFANLREGFERLSDCIKRKIC